MSLILLIETATTVCSVALARDREVIAYKDIDQWNIHSEVITIFTAELLKEAGFVFDDLDAVAVSSGPGSYTGLRIGVSTAKGLCFALDKPLIGIETLAAMANGISISNKFDDGILLCPMIDARRMEVYTAIFDVAGNQLKETAAEIIDENSFNGFLAGRRILFFGDGAAKCQGFLGHQKNALFDVAFTNSARYLKKIAADKYQQGKLENVAYFEPFYLKDFIAGKSK